MGKKSVNNLYKSMLERGNVEEKFHKAAKGKTERPDVAAILDPNNIQSHVDLVIEQLSNTAPEGYDIPCPERAWKPTNHGKVRINEGTTKKVRTIEKPRYNYEQVVHHLVVSACYEIFMQGMYEFSCGSVPKRGAHYGKKYIEKWIQTDRKNCKYVLKMDIRHFFETVDHDILKGWIAEKIRDKRMLYILDLIINGAGNPIKNDRKENKGLPLGFYTSQWLANFLLQPLDHYIKEELHAVHYMRFADDMVVFGRNKKELHRMQQSIALFLREKMNLEMKGNWQVFEFVQEVEEYAIQCESLSMLQRLEKDLIKMRIKYKSKMHKHKRKIFVKVVSVKKKLDVFTELIKKYDAKQEIVLMEHGRPLDFMGFQFYHNRTILRESIMLSCTRKVDRVSKKDVITWYDATAILSYMGYITHTDTYEMYLQLVKPYVNVKKLKKIVSKHSKKKNKEMQSMEETRFYCSIHAGDSRSNGHCWGGFWEPAIDVPEDTPRQCYNCKYYKMKGVEKHERMERSVRNGDGETGGVRHTAVTDNGVSEAQHKEGDKDRAGRNESDRMAAGGA